MTEIVKGEVLTKSKDHGNIILSSELLLAPRTKISLIYNEDNKYIDMIVSDIQLDIDELSGQIDLDTLEDYIKSLKTMYNQLKRNID